MRITYFAALAAAATVMISASQTVAAQATFDKIKSRGQINIGYRPVAQPFAMEDSTGKPVGYALEFCNAIAERLASVTGGVKKIRLIPVARQAHAASA